MAPHRKDGQTGGTGTRKDGQTGGTGTLAAPHPIRWRSERQCFGRRRRHDECLEHELRDTFVPWFSDCSACRGFVFSMMDDDVKAQFGCCGCLVAAEMEMLDAYLQPSKVLPPSSPDDKVSLTMFIDEALKKVALSRAVEAVSLTLLHAERTARKPSELFYLNRWQSGQKPQNVRSQAKMRLTTQMKTRHRLSADKACRR